MNKYKLMCVIVTIFTIVTFTMTNNYAVAQSCTQPPSGLVGWWPGDGNANDISGGGQNGTIKDGVIFSPGKVNLGFDLNGIDGRVEITDSPAFHFGTGDLTIEAWIKTPAGATNYQSIIGKEQQSFPYPSIVFRLTDGGLLQFAVTDCGTGACGFSEPGEGGSRQPVQSPFRVDDDVFHHVAGVRHSSGYELYVDGQLVATRLEPARNGDNGVPFFIGIQGIQKTSVGSLIFPFNGIIDKLEIYNRALTPSEIQGIFNAGSAGKCKDGDNDGVPDSQDSCSDSIMTPTIIIDDCNSSVPNVVFPDGCTISDKIQQCTVEAQNHGQFVSCVAHLTDELKKAGVITGKQKGAIQSCAAEANIP